MEGFTVVRSVWSVLVVVAVVLFHPLPKVSSAGVTTASVLTNSASKCQCKFPKHQSTIPAYMERLSPICGERYSVSDDLEDGYNFEVGICVPAQLGATENFKFSGVVQKHKKSRGDEKVNLHSVGSIEHAEVMAGSNWLILEYEGGDNFSSHCKNENRRTIIMILCKKGQTVGNLRWIEENSNKTSDCYYLFQMDHEAACSSSPSPGLSSGSIICIVLAVVIGVYMLGGIMYMRFIKGAKGLNQIPNYSFWRDFGALQADGCDLLCRCGGKQSETKYYHGIGDHQIECAGDNEEVDEHLLPM